MQSMQRHFGRYMKRSADDQQVSILLKEFEDADLLLAKIIDAAKTWRESWISILTFQARLVAEFEILYTPIVGAGEDYQGHVALETPDHVVSRTSRIKTEYEDLKRDLKDVLDQVDYMMIKPAQEAKDNMQMFKKTIKKREDKKLDYERYQNRVDSGLKKNKRSDRDNAALAKSEKELDLATESYKAADDHLRQVLPPLLQAVYSLQPYILVAQIQIQNTLLGHYYTSLHNYCTDEGFPNPAPPMDEVIRLWDDALRPVQKEAESIAILATSKSVRLGPPNGNNNSNGYRRPSQTSSFHRVPSVSPARAIGPSSSAPQLQITDVPSRPKITSTVSSNALLTTSQHHQQLVSSPPEMPLTVSSSPSYSSDYFSRGRQPSQSSNLSAGGHHQQGLSPSPSPSAVALAGLAAGKKKPPPPPGRKRSEQQQAHFVTALYDFGGQGEGDLVFREGDKIRVVKKTDSTDDWWQGELRGVLGMFPANYCQ